jgi:hypothetical protein
MPYCTTQPISSIAHVYQLQTELNVQVCQQEYLILTASPEEQLHHGNGSKIHPSISHWQLREQATPNDLGSTQMFILDHRVCRVYIKRDGTIH